jgi:CRP-like cAMP-binding protein
MLGQSMIKGGISQQPATGVAQVPPPVGTHALVSQIKMIGAVMPFARNAEIYGENERAEYLYKVLSGSVRAYKVLNDGRRQIGAFYLPGDVFGFEVGDEHSYSAEAIVDCKLLVVGRTSVMSLAARDSSVARQLWTMTAVELQRAQDHMMLLIKTAQERVAGFLLEMSKRSPTCNEINLPMSRQDIADYLGLTLETVSRTLTQLKNAAAIAVPSSRHIVLCNRSALSRLNS